MTMRNMNTYIIEITLANRRKFKRMKFHDYEKAMREYYDCERKYPEHRGYELVFIEKSRDNEY